MVFNPANFFQLLDGKHADFALGVNVKNLSANEKMLWHNIELYAAVVKEAGLESKLVEAHEEALREFATTENERFARYRRR